MDIWRNYSGNVRSMGDCIPTSRVEESTTAVRDPKSYTTKYCTIIHNHPQPRAATNGTRPSCKVLDGFVEAFGSSAQHQLQPSKTSAEITSVITTSAAEVHWSHCNCGTCHDTEEGQGKVRQLGSQWSKEVKHQKPQ